MWPSSKILMKGVLITTWVLVQSFFLDSNVRAATNPLDDFRKAYWEKDYEEAFDILTRLRQLSTRPAVFGKLLGVVAHHLGGDIYAMMLLEEYFQKARQDPEVMANFVVASQKVMMESYGVHSYYEEIVSRSSASNLALAVLAPEVLLDALLRNDLGRVNAFLPFLRVSRKGLLIGGVFANLNGNAEIAIRYFQRILGLYVRTPADYRIHLLARLNLARTYYEIGQYGMSAAHYNHIPRSSRLWFEAQTEASWAHFKNGELNLSLGRLHSFVSPFLLNRFFPEALVLRTVVLFELCKFAEMATTLGFFYKTYRPIEGNMSGVLSALSNTRTVAEKLLLDDDFPDDVPIQIRLHFMEHEKTLEVRQRLALLAAHFGDSLDLARRSRSAGQRDVRNIQRYYDHLRNYVIDDYGKWMIKHARSLLAHLQRKLDEASLVEIEMTIGQQEALERIEAIIRGARQSKRILAVAKEGHEFWPFYNEFWKDELGYYVINTPTSCLETPTQ